MWRAGPFDGLLMFKVILLGQWHSLSYAALEQALNVQIDVQGCDTGAVIDATLIGSAARPRKTITLEVDAEGKAVQFEDGSQPGISCNEE